MMLFCDHAIYDFVTSKYFDYLNALPPAERASEIFRLQIEHLSYEIKETDEIFGWFVFDNREEYLPRTFSDTVPDDDTRKIIDAPLLHGSRTSVDTGHTLTDYAFILKNGLRSYEEEIAMELASSPGEPYLIAMKNTLAATKTFVANMIAAAERKIASLDVCPTQLSEIRSALAQVPFQPARNFREAIQSVWIIHFLTPLAGNAWYSISLGKFDQYMYPYYQKSRAEGMTKAEAKKILYHFYQLLNSYADGACLLNVGGNTYNELSELLIECQKEFAMPAPILGARITEDTPAHIWNMLIDEKLFSAGQPTFYGEEACISALVEKGFSRQLAATFANNSCMGISLPGEEFNSMWGCVLSVSSALEAAVNNGSLLNGRFCVPDILPVKTVEDVYSEFEKAVSYLFDICVKAYEANALFCEAHNPCPLISILTKDCITKHKDEISGARYHNVTVECMGMINVADGLCAIDQLVFCQKKYTLAEMIQAVQNDFKDCEKMRNDLLNCPKFGQNTQADGFAVRIAEILQKVIRRKNHDNITYCPSLHTLDANVDYGHLWGAGFDGRRSGTPFAKNAGPSNCVRKKDPTSVLLSAMKLPQYQFFGGQPIDINFSINMINHNKKEIAALIQVYLLNGGLQLQVNALSSQVLKDAVKNPQNYEDLIVRIGGYSNYFNRFSERTKQEFIERVEREEN